MFTTKLAQPPKILVPLSCMNVLMPGLSDILVGLHKAGLQGAFQQATKESDRLDLSRGPYSLHFAMSSNGDHIQISYSHNRFSSDAKTNILYPISEIGIHGNLFDGAHYEIDDVTTNFGCKEGGIDELFPTSSSVTESPLQDRLILGLLAFAAIQKTHEERGEDKDPLQTFEKHLGTIVDKVYTALSSHGITTYADGLFYRAEYEQNPLLILHPEFIKKLALFIDPQSVNAAGNLIAEDPVPSKDIRPTTPPPLPENRAKTIFLIPSPPAYNIP